MIYLWRDHAAACWVVSLEGAEIDYIPGDDIGPAIDAAIDHAERHDVLAFLLKDDGRCEHLDSRVWSGEDVP